MDVSKETEQKISQLQMFEQSMQSFLGQKQQFQVQLVEIESALNELDNTEKAYKIVGSIMVQSDKNELKADLKSKKEMLELRIKTMEKQESQVREKASKLQSEILKKIKKED
ncbi:prefoldin subunit beta [Candidatus Woesearchaeota archaeon]|jgi:prefoldin beta subunit|nr:prefoldin subunit beta [Candidatus Woesearchaeota archaeon]MDP6648031.1 prefoldin subunit beta [Candidatus Woesearchaeota archaeon]|tara:strand:+ start:43046 stop:43381 length:336 start_codon:yes stop_codon:yes gene_type:complete